MSEFTIIPSGSRPDAAPPATRIYRVLMAGLLVLVLLGGVYALALHSTAAERHQLAALTRQTAAARVNVKRAPEPGSPESSPVSPAVQKQVRQVLGLAKARFDWPDAMAQMALALPADVTLTALSATIPAPGSLAAGTATRGSALTFTLVGCASSQVEVAGVLSDLQSVPGVSNVPLIATIEKARAPAGLTGQMAQAYDGACPYVTFTVGVTYKAAYTVPGASR